jgi:hypothetical protein
MSTLTIVTPIDITLVYDGTNFSVGIDTYTQPITIINSSGSVRTVSLDFPLGNITGNSCYIIAGSNDIIFDGQNQTININNKNNYPGLISNTIYSNITVKNIVIHCTGTTLMKSSGSYVCQQSFINGTIDNCSSDGPIRLNSGGILGADCVNCAVTNCSSTGTITGGGGIFGGRCNNSGSSSSCTATNCFSTGAILDDGGGIFGGTCNNLATGSSCIATNCYSTGNIGSLNHYNCGGLFGSNANTSAADFTCTCSAINCWTTGTIFGDVGGSNGGLYGSNCSYCSATKCFSTGTIGTSCGGIFNDGRNLTSTKCYSCGSIDFEAGGIFGSNVSDSSAFESYSIGSIGIYGGGIFGYNSSVSAATDCYSIGTINITGSGGGGGIFGFGATSCTSTNCYIIDTTIFGAGGTLNTETNCFIESGGNWSDANATITLITTNWVLVGTNSPWLLKDFNATMYSTNPLSTVDPSPASGSSILGSTYYTGVNINTYYLYDSAGLFGPQISTNSSTGNIIFTNIPNGTYNLHVLQYCNSSSLVGGTVYVGYNTNQFTLTITTGGACLTEDINVIMADRSIKKIKNIQRGDKVLEDIKTGKINTVARLYYKFTNIEVGIIPKGLIGNNKKIIGSTGHPIWCNNETNRITIGDITGAYKTKIKDNVYNIQYEDEGSFYANGIKVDSIPPCCSGYMLHKHLYFDENKYTGIMLTSEDDPIRNKPKMISESFNYWNIDMEKFNKNKYDTNCIKDTKSKSVLFKVIKQNNSLVVI